MRYKRIYYNLNVMRQSACLVINPITAGGYAALFNCTPVYRCYEMDKTSIFMFEILEPGGQLWANTAFEGSQFYSIGVPKFYSWVNVISVYAYNDLG